MLVILDRDGVINEDSDAYVKSLAEWHPIPGSIEAIAALSRQGFSVAIATNQSGVGRGLFDLDALEAMHARLNELVRAAGGDIAGIFYCIHTPDDDCHCRKPRAGLIDAIARELGIDPTGAWLIGDSLRDLEAGLQRDCVPVLVLTGKGARSQQQLATHSDARLRDARVFPDLAAAAAALIAEHSGTMRP